MFLIQDVSLESFGGSLLTVKVTVEHIANSVLRAPTAQLAMLQCAQECTPGYTTLERGSNSSSKCDEPSMKMKLLYLLKCLNLTNS